MAEKKPRPNDDPQRVLDMIERKARHPSGKREPRKG